MDNYEIINGKKYKKCPEGKIRNMATMRCIKIKETKEVKKAKETKEVKKAKETKEVKKTREVKNTNINKKINIEIPLNYKFNKENVKKFLEECNKPFLNPETNEIESLNTAIIAKKIIDNTQHIEFEKFISLLETNINDMIKLVEKGRPIFFDMSNNKRTNWLFKYISEYIKINYPNIKIITLNSYILDNKKLIDNDIIIHFKDALINAELNFNCLKFKNINNHKLRFFLLSSFIDKDLLNSLEKKFNFASNLTNINLIINKTYIIANSIKDFLTNSEIKILDDIYLYLGDFKYANLIYFDHYLGNPYISVFYRGVVPNAANKYYINKKYNIGKNLNNLDELKVIPILTNCENETKYDMYKINCPKLYN